MKAITLWQPYATLISIGAKRFETRSWAISFRGPLAIHAAKRPVDKSELLRSMADALVSAGFTGTGQLPLSCVVCVVDLVECYPTAQLLREEWFAPHKERESDFGDLTPGRFAWQLENVRYQENLFARGYQGLWEWDAPAGWE